MTLKLKLFLASLATIGFAYLWMTKLPGIN